MSGEIKPAYLIAGSDEAKVSSALARLRARAEREGGAGALESFDGGTGRGADALIAAIPAMSLTAGRRYLLADGVERWSAGEIGRVAGALGDLGPGTTVVLAARGKAPRKLAGAVKRSGGEVLEYQAPQGRQFPRWLAGEARRRGFELDTAGARLLVERMGTSTVRLGNELDRLALWAKDRGRVSRSDLEAMIADTSEEAAWALSDAIIERRAGEAVIAAERLAEQGQTITSLVYTVASRLRRAHRALAELERGGSPTEVESRLEMHPYAAKMLMRRLRGAAAPDLRAALGAIADLEFWCRGGSHYDERVALTIAVRRAAGAGET